MNLRETHAILTIFGLAQDREIPDGMAEVWAAALDDVPFDLGRAAALELVRTSPYLPKVSDLRAHARLIHQQQQRDRAKTRQLEARDEPPVRPERTGAAIVRHVLGRLADAGQDVPNGKLLGHDRAATIAEAAVTEWLHKYPAKPGAHVWSGNEIAACRTCYAPTTDPERHCP